MEDDDEFGDLYTDVLRPFTTSFQSHPPKSDVSMPSQSSPIDRVSDNVGEEILRGAPDSKNIFSNSNQVVKLSALIQEKTLAETVARPEIGGLGLNTNSGTNSEVPKIVGGDVLELKEEKRDGALNFNEEDDDLNIVVEERDDKDDVFVEKPEIAAEGNENAVDLMGEQMIQGLSGKSENQGGLNVEDEWESDESEDDLQIVLNDNHEQMGMAPGGDEDDEDGKTLVIVADNGDSTHRPTMEDPDWGPVEADGERKELGEGARASAAPMAVQPKIGYSNHLYHHPSYHSQFKYVRPGTTPMPSTVPTGVTQGQARPLINMGPMVGRGRGDWRPPGVKGVVPMQKGPHPGYGMPVWGANSAGRGYGSGLDFTLPSHKSIFEVDIDSFEEKPWKLPGIDVSDFFNFGLNEESWKEYCKHLEQLRLETTMQSKIHVYDIGRAEQDYDPDLPPELAAAVGIQDIPSEIANSGRADASAADLARIGARGRPPVQPIGRPIPVETGSVERQPSVDTRRPRMQDLDAIIEIFCGSSTYDDEIVEQQDEDQVEEDANDDLQPEKTDRAHHFSRAYNGQKSEPVSRREQLKGRVNHDEIRREDDLHVSEASGKLHPNKEIDHLYEERSLKGRGHVISPNNSAKFNSGEKQILDDENESFDSGRIKQSSSSVTGSIGKKAVAVVDDVNNTSLVDDRSFDTERENMALDETTSDALKDGKLIHSTKHSHERENSKAARSSDTSKARSGSSKDCRKSQDTAEDEVLQNRQHPRTGNNKRDENNIHTRSRHGRDETRKHIAVKDREDSLSRRDRHMKSESTEFGKEGDITEGSWRRRDEDRHGRRIEIDDKRKRDHGADASSINRGKARESERGERDEHNQSRSQLDSNSLRLRSRGERDNIKTQIEKSDNVVSRRQREGLYEKPRNAEKEEIAYNHRESSSRRKRDRDDFSDQRKSEDYAKLKDEDMRYVRQKEEVLVQKERGERPRNRDEWHRQKQSHEEILPRREREETRPVVRSGRTVEDKPWASHSRGKDDYKGSVREYPPKDIGRHIDLLKRRDRVENESFSHHRGHEDVYVRGNHGSSDENRAKYSTGNDYASDSSRMHERKQKIESESQDPSSLISSKRNGHERSVQISETGNARGRSNENEPSRKKGEEGGSSDEEQRRGRSKLERWTSHKERDFGTPVPSSSLKNNKDTFVTAIPEQTSNKVEENKDTPVEDKHLDTVEKLKKRSERFKLPMPSEKETLVIKTEALPENRLDSEIKSERPPRKRRWTGN